MPDSYTLIALDQPDQLTQIIRDFIHDPKGADPMRRFARLWKAGTGAPTGPVHVSMNDYVVHRYRHVLGVAVSAMRFRQAWPRTDGALGLWVATTGDIRRSISVSVWRTPEDLRHFTRTPAHLRVMRDYRHAGELRTVAWTAERFDRELIWRQAEEQLHAPSLRAHSQLNRPVRGQPPPSRSDSVLEERASR